MPPKDAWRTWAFLGGRGAGKTRAGAEWVLSGVRARRSGRIALIGQTLHAVREVMIEGRSGLRARAPHERPAYEASRRRLIWPNGAVAYAFSAEDPESLRGPQFDAAWADEMCYWAYPGETLETLEHGLRVGADPRLVITTTPRPIAALRQVLARPDTVVSRASTWANEQNLAPGFIAALRQRWAGSVRERQEILGELIEGDEGALWRRAALEALRRPAEAPLERIVIGVDPPAGVGPNAAACGIVAAARFDEGRRAVVVADASVRGASPHEWASRVAALARSLGAHAIVAEGNNGGEMVRAVLNAAAPECAVRLVRASEGKRARAEPIAALYAQGRITHAAAFPELEDEMCAFGAIETRESPDRVDALVWALTDLLLNAVGRPRVRAL